MAFRIHRPLGHSVHNIGMGCHFNTILRFNDCCTKISWNSRNSIQGYYIHWKGFWVVWLHQKQCMGHCLSVAMPSVFYPNYLEFFLYGRCNNNAHGWHHNRILNFIIVALWWCWAQHHHKPTTVQRYEILRKYEILRFEYNSRRRSRLIKGLRKQQYGVVNHFGVPHSPLLSLPKFVFVFGLQYNSEIK